jgi:hypothetical protein
MATISLRVDDRDEKLFREYARLNRMTVSELLRKATLELIEDEIDLALFDKALAEMKTTHTLAEVKQELGLG